MADNMHEEWRPVVGFEHKYLVSSRGSVLSLRASKQLSLRTNTNGYYHVELWNNGIKKIYRVHSLVASAFLGERPLKHHVNHIDGNKQNNSMGNLEYVTQAENNRHAFKLGLNHYNLQNLRPENMRRFTKLTDSQVAEIRALKGLVTQAKLAQQFGVDDSHISMLQNNRRRKP
ncbi:NUMOD4 motif-containing HNH endonuclease [Zavarzinella formosa]|uniref:NUMOD4 motif-containing HNH endonuclease n=1 Tax=Zavarzinella formosa TaxID=360055 RepID=UPI0003709C10|nr:NUMOD4 motif-containing HNH endonuclease [Zavarzinella formosa]